MMNSLKRGSNRSKSKPALMSFNKSSSIDQENWHPSRNRAQYNIRRESYEHSQNNSALYQYENVNQSINGTQNFNDNFNSVRTPYDRNNHNYYDDYNSKIDLQQRYFGNNYNNGHLDSQSNLANSQQLPLNNGNLTRQNSYKRKSSRRTSETKSLRQSFPIEEQIPRNSIKPVKYFSQTGTINKTVGGVMKKRKHVVFLGLDGSGKTTSLMQLKYKCYLSTTPTVGFNHEKVWGGGFRWSVWDVGGGERLRPLWATYTRGTDGIVFVLDASCNSDTMEENRLELAKIMKLSKATAFQLHRPPPPLLVLANFQDNPMARCAPEVAESLSLPQEGPTAATSLWGVACVCAVTGEGLDEAMATLRNLMDMPSNSKSKEKWRY